MIEEKLAALTAAIEANTAALREILDAGATPDSGRHFAVFEQGATLTTLKGEPKPAKARRKTTPITETEEGEEPVVETPVPEPVLSEAAEKLIKDASDKIIAAKVAAVNAAAEKIVAEQTPSTEESSAVDPEALIASIIETFKAKMTGAPDAERKGLLKTQLPVLRAKWGLGPDDKLAVLTPTPEKLVGLLADIEAL